MKQVNPFYKTPEWRALRRLALKRDHFECVECKRQGLVSDSHMLQVDHIQPLDERPDLALKLSNLQCLCPHHHNVKHGRFDKMQQQPKRWPDERWD